MQFRRFGPAAQIAALALLAGSAQAGPGAIKWSKSFDTAIAEARRTNKLVMADFYTDW